MGVPGFTRVESATRRRSCAGESRAPTPASVGAIFPKFVSPGTAWHSVHAPASRFTTILRPRAASPGSEVRARGIASPTASKRTGSPCAQTCEHATNIATADTIVILSEAKNLLLRQQQILRAKPSEWHSTTRLKPASARGSLEAASEYACL